MSRLTVRLLETHDEFGQCERIQRSVWGLLNVSREVLYITQKYGGVVLGAFVGPRLAGFLYAFLAQSNGVTDGSAICPGNGVVRVAAFHAIRVSSLHIPLEREYRLHDGSMSIENNTADQGFI